MYSIEQNILITGASKGLGKALALEYAKNSKNSLFLLGRNGDDLKEVQKICSSLNVSAKIFVLDIQNKNKVERIMSEILASTNIDLVILCAAVSEHSLTKYQKDKNISEVEKAKTILNTNLYGTLNVLFPILEKMKTFSKIGKIVFISSMASFFLTGQGHYYLASKIALNKLAESFMIALEPFNIKVLVVIPGYINTSMIEGSEFKTFFILTPEKAALKIAKGISRNKKIIAFPWILFVIAKIFVSMPLGVRLYLSKKLKKYFIT